MEASAASLTPMRRADKVLVLLYVLALVQLAWYLPRMPAVMATHYDGSGLPNGTMTRAFAAGFHLAILGVTAAAFVGLPLLLGRMAPGLINLPHRDYWLAPERRAETLAALRGKLAGLGCGSVLLMLVISELNFRANLNPPARLPTLPVVGCLVGFVVFMVAWIVLIYRRFPPPPGR